METLIWAIGTMFILLLIISFLPMGITIKGKIFVVLAGFFLALVGHAATSVAPVWQACIIMLLLVLIVAYLLDTRLSSAIYMGKEEIEDDFNESQDSFNFGSAEMEKTTELDVIDISPFNINNPSLTETKNDQPILELEPKINFDEKALLDELFVLDDLPILNELAEPKSIGKNEDVLKNDAGYLSEIERLLEDEPEGLDEILFAMDEVASSKETNQIENEDNVKKHSEFHELD